MRGHKDLFSRSEAGSLAVYDFGMSGRVGNVTRVVKQACIDYNPLCGAVLGEAHQHVVVGVIVDECERVHRGAILEQHPSPEALVLPSAAPSGPVTPPCHVSWTTWAVPSRHSPARPLVSGAKRSARTTRGPSSSGVMSSVLTPIRDSPSEVSRGQ